MTSHTSQGLENDSCSFMSRVWQPHLQGYWFLVYRLLRFRCLPGFKTLITSHYKNLLTAVMKPNVLGYIINVENGNLTAHMSNLVQTIILLTSAAWIKSKLYRHSMQTIHYETLLWFFQSSESLDPQNSYMVLHVRDIHRLQIFFLPFTPLHKWCRPIP